MESVWIKIDNQNLELMPRPSGSAQLRLTAVRQGADMTREEIEALWKDPKNRKWGCVYYCKDDPRVVVPKQKKWAGWTINFAHTKAIPTLALLIVLVLAPVLGVVFARTSFFNVILTVGATIFVLCLVCAYLASRTE